MVKSEEKRLGNYVIMPANLQTSFKNWWRSQSPSAMVRFPHERRGNAGRVSNSANQIHEKNSLSLLTVIPSQMNAQRIHLVPQHSLCWSSPPFKHRRARLYLTTKNVCKGRLWVSSIGFNVSWVRRKSLRDHPITGLKPFVRNLSSSRGLLWWLCKKVKLKFMLQSAQASPQDVKKLEDELKCIKQQKGLRWTSRLYNVPLETLRRQVTGAVEQGCTTWTPNSS